MQKFIRLPSVKSQTGKTTSRIYAEMAEGTFPKPVKIGPRAVAWLQSEIDAWIESKIAEREAA
tara:strand:+ start:487 stop:675 length:189 start_codon:yes stop_codon:yes gene_type:complete